MNPRTEARCAWCRELSGNRAHHETRLVSHHAYVPMRDDGPLLPAIDGATVTVEADKAPTTEPRTSAGRAHLEWLMQAKVPDYTGEIYRSNFLASVAQIEAEATASAIERVDVDTLAAAVIAVCDEASVAMYHVAGSGSASWFDRRRFAALLHLAILRGDTDAV